MSTGGIELRILGVSQIAGAPAPDATGLLGHPKLLALLTYLLVSRPRGFHRRERLVSLFWPTRTEPRARHALRQVLHELRRILGPVIDTRGTQEVAAAPQVWCDAVAFDEAIQERDLVRAVSLYRGELLDGLVIRTASAEFNQWLERERTRYRADAGRAACGLAERAFAEGNPSSTVRWARRAAEIAPLDESLLCRLLDLYHELGYRAVAENLYRVFEHRLQSEFALQPSEQTRSLMQAIRGT